LQDESGELRAQCWQSAERFGMPGCGGHGVRRLPRRERGKRERHHPEPRRAAFPEGYKEKLTKYHTINFPATKQESGAGWGKEVPDMLRNADWNYAVFTTDKQHRPGVNQAECFACHKPLDSTSYVFTLKQLAGAK
jgi:hypothetical protein